MIGLLLKVTGLFRVNAIPTLDPSSLPLRSALVEGQSASMTPVCAVPPDTVPRLTVEEMLSAQCHLDMLSAILQHRTIQVQIRR
jgi:hypothetical protein